MRKKRILYCILNWGLGHATRSIPVIQALILEGHEVILVSTGRSLALLQKEFSICECIDLPDYAITYSRSPWALIPHLLLQMPRIFYRLFKEHTETKRIVRDKYVDLIVSDNRYGCYSRRVPCIFMIHQLRFQLPHGLQWSAFISEIFNRIYFRHYRAVLVPDTYGRLNLSGALSHSGRIFKHPKLKYIGLLSSLDMHHDPVKEDIDFLFMISGPEPSRSVFEQLIFEQAASLNGRKVAVLGKPESVSDHINSENDLEQSPHLDRDALSEVIARADLVICRSGYSTMMELAALKKKAILIPTPGQTEQEYLARHAMEMGLFYAVSQKELDLMNTVHEAQDFYKEVNTEFPVNHIKGILNTLGLD